MCVPVYGPQVLIGCDAGSLSRPTTSTGRGGCSWDGTMMPRKEEEETCRNRAAGLSGYHGGRRAASVLGLVLIAAINLVPVESESSEVLVELPSGFRCTWNNLPHLVQFVAIFLMLGVLCGVNRLFDKADEAVSTRLSCATVALLHERRRHHYAPRIPKPLRETKPRLQQQQHHCASVTGKPKCFGHGGMHMSPLGHQQHVHSHPEHEVFQ